MTGHGAARPLAALPGSVIVTLSVMFFHPSAFLNSSKSGHLTVILVSMTLGDTPQGPGRPYAGKSGRKSLFWMVAFFCSALVGPRLLLRMSWTAWTSMAPSPCSSLAV